MGQMTYGVLYGVNEEPPALDGEEGWYEVLSRYGTWESREKDAGPDCAHGDGRDSFHGIGFWVAVGGSGHRHAPYLESGPLDDFGSASKEYKTALAKAKKRWEKFAAWCAKPHSGGEGDRAWKLPAIKLPAPRLWLVQTEVA